MALKKQGFTLVEAIAVICIVSILASGSILLLGGSLRSAGQKASVSNILNLVERSRRESMWSEVELRYDLQNQSIEFGTLDFTVAKQAGEILRSQRRS